jgi:broad specificity phosphatase PhoE
MTLSALAQPEHRRPYDPTGNRPGRIPFAVTDLVIVRHAQSVWNAESRWQGWADPPLSALGQQQAADAGRTLSGLHSPVPIPDLIAASDLRRARQTAELLAAGLRRTDAKGPDDTEAGPRPDDTEAGPRPDDTEARPGGILIDPDLREYDTGDWTGLRRGEIEARWPRELAEWDAGRLDTAPGGEDRAVFVARLFAALERIRHAAAGRPVLVVSHGRAIHAVTEALGGGGGHVGHLTGWHLRLGPAPVLVHAVSLLGFAPPARTAREI